LSGGHLTIFGVVFCFRRKGVDKLGSVKKIRHKLNDCYVKKIQRRKL